jgi:hypothetical protein
MARPLRPLTLLSLCLVASPAHAGGSIDAQASSLADHAITTEYLETHFDAAEKELKQALMVCGPSGCSAEVMAEIHRNLGVVYFVGMGRAKEGKAEFVEALKADPQIALDADLTTPEVEAAFTEAASSLGLQANSPKAKSGAKKNAEAEAPAPKPGAAGDIVHTPPAEQMVNTPVPIYVEAPPGESFKKVKIHYRPYGATEWKVLELDRVKGGWGIEIPCLDVGTTGTIAYFIQGFDEAGDVGATSGSRQAPHSVAIVQELSSEPPHLPGRAAPAQCRDASDCPPDFPGCESKDSGTKNGSGNEKVFRKNWLSLGVQQDFLFVGGTKGVCDGATGYACFRPNDTYYDAAPLPNANGEVAGGVGLATTRVLAGYDRVIAANWTAGARVGYAFGGGPQAPGGAAFLPAHAEARGAYWFGQTPFARDGVRPFVQVSGGLAQIDTEIDVKTFDNQQAFQTEKRTSLNAWRKSGTGFASVGGGVAYALASRHVLVAELRLMQMLGLSATAIGFNVGYGFGL